MFKKLQFLVFFLALNSFFYSNNLQDYSDMINKREAFLREAFAQPYDSTKVKIDSKSALSMIDFCSFPPDRSLVFGALDNGRFHGQKLNDLPFTCNQSSGAKKFFLQNASITQAFYVLKNAYPKLLLPNNLPTKSSSESFSSDKIHNFDYIFERFDATNNSYVVKKVANDRFWIIYSGGISRFMLVFTQKGKDVEVIMQYLNL